MEERKEFFNRLDIPPWDYLDISFNDFADDLIELPKKGLNKVSSELEEAFPLDFLQFPTIDIDFNLPNTGPIPDLTLTFALNDLELYLDLEVTLTVDAIYTLPLFFIPVFTGNVVTRCIFWRSGGYRPCSDF